MLAPLAGDLQPVLGLQMRHMLGKKAAIFFGKAPRKATIALVERLAPPDEMHKANVEKSHVIHGLMRIFVVPDQGQLGPIVAQRHVQRGLVMRHQLERVLRREIQRALGHALRVPFRHINQQDARVEIFAKGQIKGAEIFGHPIWFAQLHHIAHRPHRSSAQIKRQQPVQIAALIKHIGIKIEHPAII